MCNIKIGENSYLKIRTVSKSCYNKIRRKNKNNTLIQSQQPKSDNDKKKRKIFDSVNKNRTVIIRFLNCGKTYLMKYNLLRKQNPLYITTKTLNQYPNIKAQISDEIEPLEKYENSTVVFNDMLLSKPESEIDLFFTRGYTILLIYTIFLKVVSISQKLQFAKTVYYNYFI